MKPRKGILKLGQVAASVLAMAFALAGCPPNALLSDLEERVDAAKVLEKVATPVLSPSAPGGTYSSPTDLTGDSAVTITCDTPGATIHYTDDGSTPSVSTPLIYTEPIPVAGDRTTKSIKAVGIKAGMADSDLAQESYSIAYDRYSVFYDGNGNTGGAAPVDSTTYICGQQITVLGSGTLVKAGWLFTGWNTARDGSDSAYAAGEQFAIGSGNLTLFAQWRFLELVASDGAAGDYFGYSVAASGDGGTLAIGANQKTVGSKTFQGAVYVFTGSGSDWAQLELAASDGAISDDFGCSVAASDDGGTLVVGADGKASSQGAAYVFVKTGSSWSQVQKLVASDGAAEDLFGYCVAASGDGSTIVVGAHYNTVGGNENQGAAYVFTKSGSTWANEQKLTASDGAYNDRFGCSVAVSGDCSTVVIGAFGESSGKGAAYVFTKPGSTWVETQKLTASDADYGDWFGNSVAASHDGSTLAVGAYKRDSGENDSQGAAYVFTKSSTWSQAQEFIAPDGAAFDQFGGSVAVSSSGSTLAVGAYGKASYRGAVYVFTESGGTWSQAQVLTASDAAASAWLGHSVAVSDDAGALIIGAYGYASKQGAVYIFNESGGGWSQ